MLFIFLELSPKGSNRWCSCFICPLNEAVARNYTRQILLGLDFLHSQLPPIIHRDIKGANVLLWANAECNLLTLARPKRLNQLRTGTNENRTLIGTPFWMAPEVIRESGHGRKGRCVVGGMHGACPITVAHEHLCPEAGRECSVRCLFLSQQILVKSRFRLVSLACVRVQVIEMMCGRAPWSDLDRQSRRSSRSRLRRICRPCQRGASPACLDLIRATLTRDPELRPSAADLLHHPWLLSASPAASSG